MRRLHRLLHDLEQLSEQLLQVDFVTQCDGERSKRTSRIILAAIEAVVNTFLNSLSKWSEECCDDEWRD
jgi:hypothetical protein